MWTFQGASDSRWTSRKTYARMIAGIVVVLGAGCQGSDPVAPPPASTGLAQAANLAAAAFTAARGTLTQTAVISENVRVAGPNTIVELTTAGAVIGTLSGTTEDRFTVIIHPNETFTAQGNTTCVCTVEGRSGVLYLRVTDTGDVVAGVPRFQGRWVILGGTDELSGLQGVLQADGAVDVTTGFSTIGYSGWVQFQP